MFRFIAWAVLALYLLIVGLWPSAAAPVGLAFEGLGAVAASIPGPALLLLAGIAWLRHKPTPKTATA
jgi:hypothetical protein